MDHVGLIAGWVETTRKELEFNCPLHPVTASTVTLVVAVWVLDYSSSRNLYFFLNKFIEVETCIFYNIPYLYFICCCRTQNYHRCHSIHKDISKDLI